MRPPSTNTSPRAADRIGFVPPPCKANSTEPSKQTPGVNISATVAAAIDVAITTTVTDIIAVIVMMRPEMGSSKKNRMI
jgi:hypothetical protein